MNTDNYIIIEIGPEKIYRREGPAGDDKSYYRYVTVHTPWGRYESTISRKTFENNRLIQAYYRSVIMYRQIPEVAIKDVLLALMGNCEDFNTSYTISTGIYRLSFEDATRYWTNGIEYLYNYEVNSGRDQGIASLYEKTKRLMEN